MSLSDEDQEIVNAIVAEIKQAQSGDAESVLRPSVNQIVALCDLMVSRSPHNDVLRAFVSDVYNLASREAVQAFGRMGTMDTAWNQLADGLKEVSGE